MRQNRWLNAFHCFAVVLFCVASSDQYKSEPKADEYLNANGDLSIAEQRSINESFGKIPLHFEERKSPGSDVHFLSRSGNHSLLLKKTEAVLLLPGSKDKRPDILKMKLAGAKNEIPAIEGIEKLAGTANYYVGNGPDKWQENVSTYKKVKYSNVYQGVDLIYYGNQKQLEYDFVVAPNADPGSIELNFENAENIEVDKSGDLILTVGNHEVRQKAPIAYQEIDGVNKEIPSSYVVRKNKSRIGNQKSKIVYAVGFNVGAYDKKIPIVIDPVIVFSSLLGGSAGDSLFTIEAGFSVKVDSAGNVYVAGFTPSADFPVQGPYQQSSNGNFDGFVTKFNPTGSALIYSTYFGGSGEDRIYSLSLGQANDFYVSGYTYSVDFPTLTPFQATNRGDADGFIARFTNSGALNYSTYLGGTSSDYLLFGKNEGPNIVAFAGTTYSANFPTANPLQASNAGLQDFFAGKLDISTNTLVFSTYFGGSGSDGMSFPSGALDSAGNIYIAGVSVSSDYPTTPNAFQTENNGSDDAVVTKINSSGTGLVYSTFVGGNLIDSADALAVDADGNAYITGFTRSANYPLVNAVQMRLEDVDAFVTKINPTGTALVYSTFLGGLDLERGSAITADGRGNCYVAGRSNSGDFPSKRALRPPRGLDDVFISKFNRNGALVFSTLIGGRSNDYGFGITADDSNNVYVTGIATESFFTTAGAFQRSLNGNADAFVAKINTSVRTVKSDFDGDGKSDLAVFRSSTGVWYVIRSSDGAVQTQHFGMSGDIPVPGDYDADGKTDYAVFRQSEGIWYILNSRSGSVRSLFWGIVSDLPVQGDYDGDGKTDVAVYRPSSGVWYIILSSSNSLRTNIFGSATDKPVPADYDGDGETDIAVYHPNGGVWLYVGSSSGVVSAQFGLNSDRPVPADYDGDGYDDISVYRPAQGLWYRMQSGSNNAVVVYQWGISTDTPTAGDYDGDGKEDIAIFRPSDGNWFVTRSSNNSFFAVPFGLNGDIPVGSSYIP